MLKKILLALTIVWTLTFSNLSAASTITVGQTRILGTNDNGNGNLLVAQRVTLTQTATLQSLSFYVSNASGRLQLGVYSNASGNPKSLLVLTPPFTPVVGWNTQTVQPTVLTPGTYWLAYLPESDNLGFKMTRSGVARYFTHTFGSMPSSFSATPTSGTYNWSFYATLTVGDSATPTATKTLTSVPTGPSATPTKTATRTLTLTPTKSPTVAPTLPGATATNTATPTVTKSATVAPSQTATAQPTSVSNFIIGEPNILGADDSGNGNTLVAQQVTLSQTATLQSLSFYVNVPAGRLQLGIYDESNGNPRNLLALTPPFTPVAGWNTQTMQAVALTPGNYWLAYLPESGSLGFKFNFFGNAKYFSSPFGSMPATFSSSSTSGSYHWSFYATLNASSASTSTTTPTATSVAPTTTPNTPTVTPTPSITVTPQPVGVLRVNPTNPRYFTDGSGKAIYLTGSHTWFAIQSGGYTDPPATFNYDAYLDWLVARNHNFFKSFAWMQTRGDQATASPWFNSPLPYLRTGPGNAADGKLKFDLNQFDQTYFDNLRSKVIKAQQKGIYVSVQFFYGFSFDEKSGWGLGDAWPYHPYNVANNINGINADPTIKNDGEDFATLNNSVITNFQKAYMAKVIDTVNDLDNVLYEICNEPGGNVASKDWQYAMVDYVHQYEATKPKQHPVGMTVAWPMGNNADLFASNAEWLSPNGDGGYNDNPPAATGAKIILTDTDHIWGVGGDRVWAWKSFTRGMNVTFMDVYDCASGHAQYNTGGNCVATSYENTRLNMGYIRAYANKMNLVAMTPRGDLVSSGYALASATEYLVYIPTGGAVTVNLAATPGTLTVEWFNPSTGTTTSGGTVAGGASRSLTPPFSGDAVLYIK